ncbi:hypothetical protein NMG60_11028691 [Bertholletia excelsa]
MLHIASFFQVHISISSPTILQSSHKCNLPLFFHFYPEMDFNKNSVCSRKLHRFTISLLFLLFSSWTCLRFTAEGRTIFRPLEHSKDEKEILAAQIGSRPPKCERRCSTCGHCEAIQVPTNPQTRTGHGSYPSSIPSISYSRGDESSNYKPMSWKCKCGNSIFNP